MRTGTRIEDLLFEWDNFDPKPSVDDLCRDCPELKAELKREIDLLKRVDRYVDASAVDTSAPIVVAPKTLGSYQILDLIGEGGMGRVFRGVNPDDGQVVAIKIPGEGAMSRQALMRFHRERRLHAPLAHPGIVRVFSSGVERTELGMIPFVVMEYVQGRRLDEFIRDHPLELNARVRLLKAICDAVAYAHRNKVIHRDLKPSNILVTVEGQPKIVDFGVAKATEPVGHTAFITETGQRIGTLQYSSPEQVEGRHDQIDCATDVYALGLIAYELLSGRRPYELSSESAFDAVRIIRALEPTRLGLIDRQLRGDLETIVHKALSKASERRYFSAVELAEDVTRYIEHRPIQGRPDSRAYRAVMFCRRYRTTVITTALVFAVLLAGVISATWQARRAISAERARTIQVADMSIERGWRSAADLDSATALLWFAHAMELHQSIAPDSWAVTADRYRIGGVQSHMPTLESLVARDNPQDEIESAENRIDVVNHPDRRGFTVRVFRQKSPSPVVIRYEDETDAPNKRWTSLNWAEVSSDGTKLVTAGKQYSAILFDLTTGHQIGEPLQCQKEVQSASFDPDGRRVVTGGWDSQVRMWDVMTGKPLWIADQFNYVLHVAFSPDGSRIAVASHDGGVWVLDSATGSRACPRMQHAGNATWVAFSPDGRELLSCGDDGCIRRWNSVSGALIGDIIHSPMRTSQAWYSVNGSAITGVCADNGVHGESMGQFSVVAGQLLIPGKARTVATWRLHDRLENIKVIPIGARRGGWGHPTRVSKTGIVTQLLADRSFIRIDVPRLNSSPLVGCWPGNLPAAHECSIGTNYAAVLTTDQRTWIVDLLHAGQIHQLPGSQVISAVISPDDRWAATLQNEGTVAVYGVGTLAELFIARVPDASFLSASQDGRYLIALSKKGALDFVDVGAHKLVSTLRPHEAMIFGINQSPDQSHWLSFSADQTAAVYSMSGDKQPAIFRHQGQVNDANWSPDAKRIVTASQDGTARIWNVNAPGDAPMVLRHSQRVGHALFNPDGRLVVTETSDDHKLHFWDASTGQRIGRITDYLDSYPEPLFVSDPYSIVAWSGTNLDVIPIAFAGRTTEELSLIAETISASHLEPTGQITPLSMKEWSAHWLKYSRIATSESPP